MSKEEAWGKVIYYLDGKCYGVAPNLQTVCLGTGDEVKEMLANPNKRTGNNIIDEIINLEIQLKKEDENGRQDTGRGVIRGGAPRAFEHREAGIRQPEIK